MANFDFMFAPGNGDTDNLQQGDILLRTSKLASKINEAHEYYSSASDYHYFMVLTQSCDLVRRGNKVKAPYITLAAVRPLSILMDRILSRYLSSIDDFPLRVCKRENETQTKQYLERLLHNTEDRFFFIRKDENRGFAQDYVVYLTLSIALRVDHYDACLESKIAQLNDVFQAKVGWLTGNIYSRVGTPDFEEHEAKPEEFKESFFEEVMYNNVVWASPEQIKHLKDLSRARKPTTEQEAYELVGEVKTDAVYLAERIANQLKQKGLLTDSVEEIERKVVNLLAGDRVFKRYLGR